MRKRKWIAALVLAMLLVCLSAAGALALEQVKFTSMKQNDDGTVTVTWDNPNGGAVTMGSLVIGNDDAANQIVPEFDVTGNSYTFRNLAPGMDYYLLVFPGVELDYGDICMVSIPELPAFDDFRFTILDLHLTHFVPRGSNYKYNYSKDLTPQEIYNMLDDHYFMVKIDFRHQTFNKSFTLPILTVVTSPNGCVVADAREITISEDSYGLWQTMAYMNNAFAAMHDMNGKIESGEYSVKVYLDGGFVGESSFTIR